MPDKKGAGAWGEEILRQFLGHVPNDYQRRTVTSYHEHVLHPKANTETRRMIEKQATSSLHPDIIESMHNQHSNDHALD